MNGEQAEPAGDGTKDVARPEDMEGEEAFTSGSDGVEMDEPDEDYISPCDYECTPECGCFDEPPQ